MKMAIPGAFVFYKHILFVLFFIIDLSNPYHAIPLEFICSLAKHFDEKLKSMNEDCKTYLYSDVDNLTVSMETTPFNRFADSANLLTFTQETCITGIKGYVCFSFSFPVTFAILWTLPCFC